MNNPISEELRKFIAVHVRSIGQLEILCLLIKDPSKPWTDDALFQIIQSNRNSITANLRFFAEKGLVSFEPASGYRFSSGNPDMVRLTLELADAYRERPVGIIEAIYGRPSDPIQSFAEAFKLRKDKP